MSAAPIRLDRVSFAWPDGTPVLTDITATIGEGRTGLIGANGAGKTTVLRLLTGELVPTSGAVHCVGSVALLPQTLTLRTGDRVADLLGVAPVLAALRAVESGSLDQSDHDLAADNWDLETTAAALLSRVGLDHLGLDRFVGAMSGGETMLVALAGIRLRGAQVTLLDEPTNNLDRAHRSRLIELAGDWPETLLVVSHDTDLLDAMDATAELRRGELTVFGGGYSAYREWLAVEQEAARRALRTAEQRLSTERRQQAEAETKLARRARYAKSDFENKRRPKIIMNLRKRDAEVSAGKLRNQAEDKVDEARSNLDGATARVRDDPGIHIDLPDPGVHARRRLLTLHQGEREWTVAGPERVALTGPNGAGKTRLLGTMPDPAEAQQEGRPWIVAHTGRIGHLDQRLDGLDESMSALDTLVAAAPSVPRGSLQAALARFLLRRAAADRLVGHLSGGERFRLVLARLLLADPPAQLLVLDEPTNNLDLDSVEALVSALTGYRGALVVVSHDDELLARLGITRHFTVDRSGRLDEVPVPAEGFRLS